MVFSDLYYRDGGLSPGFDAARRILSEYRMDAMTVNIGFKKR